MLFSGDEVDAVFAAMDGIAEPGVVTLPCRVVQRGSTAPLA